MDSLEELQSQIGYRFKNPSLLQQALTHTTLPTPTSSPFNSKKQNDLKILGDCVIKLCTCQYAICVSLPNDKVHKIVKIKDNLCNRHAQNLIGKSLQLEEKGLIVTNLQPEHVFSQLDTFLKSIFGAVFLDAGGSDKKGFVSCWKVFQKLWTPVISCFDKLKPLASCFPEPKYSSLEFLKERFNNFKVKDLKLLEERIGYKFEKNPHLLEQAMTHDSIEMFRNSVETSANNVPEFVHFQSLEFLGDSVLELVIMEYLYLRSSSSSDPLGQMLFFNRDTGQKLYSSKFQIHVASKLKLEEFVIKPPSVGIACYDDYVEALIGACYVHARHVGLRVCAKLVLELWGLESSLEEEAETATGNGATNDKPQATSSAKTVDNPVKNKVAVEAKVARASSSPVPVPAQGPGSKPSSPTLNAAPVSSFPSTSLAPSHVKLQKLIGYKFCFANYLDYLPLKIDVSTTDARIKTMNMINLSKNLQTVGKRCIDLLIAEYVIGICHSSPTADLSAEMKRSLNALMENISSDNLLNEIAVKFQLSEYFSPQAQEEAQLTNPCATPYEMIHLLFGCLYMDSSKGDTTHVKKLFLKFWSNYINGAKPKASLINCFPDTSEQQEKFRAHVNRKITDFMWQKLFKLLGHTFTYKNLMEQALTDEKSQGYAKQVCNAYPLGNPFGLQLLGKRVSDLAIARQCYLNSFQEPGNFPVLLERLDQGLYNCLRSRLAYLVNYYANHLRYPYPPKKNPRAPFECILAALYVEGDGGAQGMQKVNQTIVLAFPNFLTLSKAKAIKAPLTSEGNGAECSPRVSVSTDGGKFSGDDGPAPDSPATSKTSKESIQEQLNSSFDSQQAVSPSPPATTDGNIPQFFLSMPILKDPLLKQLQKKIGYKFVNPFLLKIVLEVNVPLGELPDDNQASSRDYFEIFRIVGGRALNLLVTEFALESVAIPENSDITFECKKQVESHRQHLASPLVISMIANKLELKKYLFIQTSSSPSYEDFITALLGAVFIDSRANYLKIAQLFNKLWKSSINPNQTQPMLANCFPNTSEAQTKLRTFTATAVTNIQWQKMYDKLGYKFKNKNLVEQALTGEGTQELAKTKCNVHSTGNPFALRLLGKCVVELVIAYKNLPTTQSVKVTTYVEGLNKIENALFNSFQNNFMGIEKYYAFIKVKKNQKFRPKNSAFEALLGAVYVDSGLGNPGCDSVAQVIIKRNIGLGRVQSLPPTGVLPVTSVPSPAKIILNGATFVRSSIPTVPVATGSNASSNAPTPTPSTCSSAADSMNTSFSSKCAANFSICPMAYQQQQNKSPQKPFQPATQQANVPPSQTQTPEKQMSTPVKANGKKEKSPKTSPKKSPKKESKKSYAFAVTNGKPTARAGDNSLLMAVSNARSQIEAMQRKQEFIDQSRKISLEKEKLLVAKLEKEDQGSNASDSGSRCASTSTVASIGNQQPNNVGQKRKRTRGKKQNKKAKAGTEGQAKQVVSTVVPPQQQQTSSRVAAWCQNQLDSTIPAATTSSSSKASASSSCTEVHQQRSTGHQLHGRRDTEVPSTSKELASHFSSSPSHSSHGSHVPVNMVSGYRKSEFADEGNPKGTGFAKNGKSQTRENVASATSEAEDATSTEGVSFMGILKWTTVILGVAFLLRKYSQGK